MAKLPVVRKQEESRGGPTLRDALLPVFRQARLARLVFTGVFLGAVAAALLMPRQYQAEMKILVNRDRVDAVVTPDANAPVAAAPEAVVTEEDLNSEVELLKGRDLLEQVVEAGGLEGNAPSRWQGAVGRVLAALRLAPQANQSTRRARAVEALANNLTVEPLKKTNMIRVTYVSRDPEQSAEVLRNLATLYQEKHAAVHRPQGAFGFFDGQADHYQVTLHDAEERLAEFDGQEGVVDPAAQEQLALARLSDFESERQREQAGAEAAERRAQALQALASATPERQTTQVRESSNAELLARLQDTLLSLELKRSDMLTKYDSAYPPVAELSEQITEAQKAIEAAEKSPVEETTSDRVPAQDWIATELAKAQADRAALEGQAAATERTVTSYRQAALELDRKNSERADLARNVKTAEDSYLLYQNKREAARISDALDNQRIVNVAIAEAATVPALPTLHLGWALIGGFFAAGSLSIGTAYAADRLSPGFRSPDEVASYLELRVLAAIPAMNSARYSREENHLLS